MMKNKQLLDAISSLINGGEFDLTDSPKSLVSNLRRIIDEAKAIAAAEQAQQGDHIGDTNKMVQAQPVPRDVLMALAVAVQANQQILSEVVALLERHQKWLNRLPVPTTGATHQMMHVVGKAIDILGGMQAGRNQAGLHASSD